MKPKIDLQLFKPATHSQERLTPDLRSLGRSTFETLADFMKSYLQHHLNNKLAIIDGNLHYARKMIQELEDLEVEDPDRRKKITSIRRGLEETLDPIEEALEKIYVIEDKMEEYLEAFAKD